MAEPKGKWRTQATVDLGSLIQGLAMMGSQFDKQESADELWGDKVVSRLTAPQSAFYISPNEYDVSIIEDGLSDLRTQHQNLIDNNSDKYKAGTYAYDSISERIEDAERQLTKANEFQLDYQNLLSINDKSTELRAVPVTDEMGNILYEKNPDGSIAVDEDGNQIEMMKMENDWTEMQSLIYNTPSDEYGRVMFDDRVMELRDSILERNIAVGSALSSFEQKYKDWLNINDVVTGDMNKKITNMYNLMGQEKMNLERIDDNFQGDFILDKEYFERFKRAVDLDEWEEFNTTNAARLQERFNEKNNLINTANSYRKEYVDLYNKIHPDGSVEHGGLSPAPPLEDGTKRWFDIDIKDATTGETMQSPKTLQQLMDKYYLQYKNVVSNISTVENQVAQGWGPQRSSVLFKDDRRLIQPFELKKFLRQPVTSGKAPIPPSLSIDSQSEISPTATNEIEIQEGGKKLIDLSQAKGTKRHPNQVLWDELVQGDKQFVLKKIEKQWRKSGRLKGVLTDEKRIEIAEHFSNMGIMSQSRILNMPLNKQKYLAVDESVKPAENLLYNIIEKQIKK
tara:strand:+ start:1754 stop:3451 length:1698 start_codon:yes stop_codon:yes gene_type:complete